MEVEGSQAFKTQGLGTWGARTGTQGNEITMSDVGVIKNTNYLSAWESYSDMGRDARGTYHAEKGGQLVLLESKCCVRSC